MAGTSLLTLLDDIASALDDVAVMTKLAAKKTAGVLGDDLALNAEQVLGTKAHRELPVVWAVAKGSALNKLILIPLALLISFFWPVLVTFLLLIGGLYLCYEGFEKVIERVFHHSSDAPIEVLLDPQQLEKSKIKGAIRTDFVLSAEIIVITLGTITTTSLLNQILVLILISVLMTLGVYGLVACIVKLDDLGLILRDKKGLKHLGLALIGTAPILMKFLAFAGTLAMFLVGGSIIAHGIPILSSLLGNPSVFWSLLSDFFIGFLSGAIVFLIISLTKYIKGKMPTFKNSSG